MVNEWIKPIYDRTYADVQALMYDPNIENAIGCYNSVDVNRVENNTAYVLEYMLEHKIIKVAPALRIKTDWKETDIIIASEMKRIVENVAVLCSLSNPMIQDELPSLYLATQMNYILANDIERALDVMHDQPEIPADYFTLKLNNGIITEVLRLDGSIDYMNTTTCLIAENEVASILAIAPEPDIEYKHFTTWSGSTDDLQYINDVASASTTYIGQYHDVEFTANFKTAYPRTLTLTNAYISAKGDDKAESGPTTGVYYAGDTLMIIANIAPSGKAFYCWEGTQAGLDAISVSDTDPSTVWLVMPDCDVKLTPKYINAGQHYVTVINGNGSGYYNYNESVNISADIPANYGFDNWSGDTQYLDDIYSSSLSFKMPDIGVSLRANSSYRPGYHNVQIINGLINGSTTVSNVKEGIALPLTATPADDTEGLDYWSVEGAGSITSPTSFIVGNGNAIITGHYGPYYTLTAKNVNGVADNTQSVRAVKGHTFEGITTSSSQDNATNYHFKHWIDEAGEIISTEISPSIVATKNMIITAVYEYVEPVVINYYNITIKNKNNTGEITVKENVREHTVFTDYATIILTDYVLTGYYLDGSFVETPYYTLDGTADAKVTVTKNHVIEYVYRAREIYTLSVSNGTIGGADVYSGQYKERSNVNIVANVPATKHKFKDWKVVSGEAFYVPAEANGYITLGRSDVGVTATYVPVINLTVKTSKGENTYVLAKGENILASASPYPELKEFNIWEVISGDATINNYLASSTYVYAQEQDSIVEASYKDIPWFDITVINGYINLNGKWVESGKTIRNSAPEIKMKPAPTGKQFLQWEVLVGDQEDVYQPLAERTSLRNVTHNITIRATYYTPDPEVKYTLTITQKDGTIQTYNKPVGTQINVQAQTPDEGYKFYRWNGDYQYLIGGRYALDNIVNMPNKNISLEPSYAREGYITKYHLYMYSAECLLSEDSEGNQTWGTDGEFEEGTKIQIRAREIPFGWKFNGWEGTEQQQTALVHDLSNPNTYLTISDFDIHMTANIIEELKYTMKITNGQTSGEYYGGARVDVYFDKEDTDTEHYIFKRWTGDVLALSLYDGGVFDVTKPGTSNEPQYVKMPLQRIEITGDYTLTYKLSLIGGHIKDTQDIYFPSNTTVTIVADPTEDQIFLRWEGDIDTIEDIYEPTTTVKIINSAKNIAAVYTTEAKRTGIGYTVNNLTSTQTLNVTDISIISGILAKGFIVMDSKGHFYVITNIIETTTAQITRMTKIDKGGDLYE